MSVPDENCLTAEEWHKIDKYDSRLHDQLNLKSSESALELLTIQRAIRFLEKRLLSGSKVKHEPGEELKEETLDHSDSHSAAKLYLKLGHLHLIVEDYAKALSAYQKFFGQCRNTCWKYPAFYYGIGIVYFHFRAFAFAIKAFRTLLYLAPDFECFTQAHLRLALACKAEDQFVVALQHLNFVQQLPSQTGAVLNRLEVDYHCAHCHDLLDDIGTAKEEYEALLTQQLTPHLRAAVLRQLGWLYFRAESDVPLPAAQHPQHPQQSVVAPSHTQTERIQQAINLLLDSNRCDPSAGKTYYYLGRCFSLLPGRAHDAFTNYRQSIDKSEADADTWCSIGVLYQHQQQPTDALQAFICAVQLDSRHAAAWVDLGLLYESNAQFRDALLCYRNACKHKPNSARELAERINLLDNELSSQPGPVWKASLPCLEDACKMPIPSELLQRQEAQLKAKQEKYVLGSAYCRPELETQLDGKGPPPPFYLNHEQLHMMQILNAQTRGSLHPEQSAVLTKLEYNYALMQQHMKLVQHYKQSTTAAAGTSQQTKSGTELPEVSHEDLLDVLGVDSGHGQQTQGTDNDTKMDTSSSAAARTHHHDSDDLMLGVMGESADQAKHDPLLSSAALPNQRPNKVEGVDTDNKALAQEGHIQDSRVSSSSELRPGDSVPSGNVPPVFSLLSQLYVPTGMSSADVLALCTARMQHPQTYQPIFDEHAPPPRPLSPPLQRLPPERLLLPTTSVVVDSKKDAGSAELEMLCHRSPCVLIKGLTTALRIDLSYFSSKTLIEQAPGHQCEVRTQFKLPPDENTDKFGNETWKCYSKRGWTTVRKYAQYQAHTFNQALKEEQDKLQAGGSKEFEPFAIRPSEGSLAKKIEFGTNVDLSDQNVFREQLLEIQKLPAFCRVNSAFNMLTHLNMQVFGMNTVQLYMKVPGCRTPGHCENNNFCSVNINIGPGDCEWFCVPEQYSADVMSLCEKADINYLHGSWWPSLKDLAQRGVPVYRFTQKAGDMVWIGPSTLHWVQATGWCNNIAWNVGPVTEQQLKACVFANEFNKLHKYKSIVAVQYLCWQLASKVKFTNQRLCEYLRGVLIRSLAYMQMQIDYVTSVSQPIMHYPRAKNEDTHYCAGCQQEAFSMLYTRPKVHSRSNGKYTVFCVHCAKKLDDTLNTFSVLQQYTVPELAEILDALTLHVGHKVQYSC